jgi:hypothetical protein
MEKLLKKDHSDIVAQLHSIQAVETPSMHPDLQAILSKHQVVFSTPPRLLSSRGVHDHSIPLVPAVFLPMFALIVIPLPKRMKLRK